MVVNPRERITVTDHSLLYFEADRRLFLLARVDPTQPRLILLMDTRSVKNSAAVWLPWDCDPRVPGTGEPLVTLGMRTGRMASTGYAASKRTAGVVQAGS